MNKVTLNYWVDVLIAVAFIFSAITGLAFLVMGSGGYQGGRNPQFMTAFLGLDREQWSDLHTLGSLVMIGGVFMHLVLHWNWIVCVTRRMIARPVRPAREAACEVTA
ncbi:MAG: DUF4405 domain-containing protein [Anaerolineae bacterium]